MPKVSAASWSKPALVQELPRDQRLGRRQQLGVVLLGDLVRLDQPAALRAAAGPAPDRPPRSAAGTPHFSASRSTVSVKPMPSISITNLMTSPPAWQPKQW